MNAHKTDSIEIYIFYMTRARVECIYLFSCIFCVYFINSQHRVCLFVCVNARLYSRIYFLIVVRIVLGEETYNLYAILILYYYCSYYVLF